MDPQRLDAYVAYALDLLDFIELCRERRAVALALGDSKRVAAEERARNRNINCLEKVFADVRRLQKKRGS